MLSFLCLDFPNSSSLSNLYFEHQSLGSSPRQLLFHTHHRPPFDLWLFLLRSSLTNVSSFWCNPCWCHMTWTLNAFGTSRWLEWIWVLFANEARGSYPKNALLNNKTSVFLFPLRHGFSNSSLRDTLDHVPTAWWRFNVLQGTHIHTHPEVICSYITADKSIDLVQISRCIGS